MREIKYLAEDGAIVTIQTGIPNALKDDDNHQSFDHPSMDEFEHFLDRHPALNISMRIGDKFMDFWDKYFLRIHLVVFVLVTVFLISLQYL